MKKNFGFSVGEVTGWGGFWPFSLRLPNLGPNARWNYFTQFFIHNLFERSLVQDTEV